MPYALLFPGQASQQVGMGADLPRLSSVAGEILAAADAACGLPLAEVMRDGPLDRLTETRFAQPAVIATSLAALAVLRERLEQGGLPGPVLCAGHSVGELAALVGSGAADASTALRLVSRRSRLMAELCDRVDGSMAAVLGLAEPALEQLCSEASAATGHHLQLANINAPDQLVVSGHREAIAWLQAEGPARGARRVLPLNVGGPFHSVYMAPAAEQFAAEVARADLRPPTVPIVLNQTAQASTDPDEIRRELGAQIASPVRWADSLRRMAELGCELFVEVGPGQVLSGLVRRTLPGATTVGVQDEASLERTLQALASQGGGA